MARRHASTPGQRARWASEMIARGGEYGLVTHLSQAAGVSRQTLYAWEQRALRALEQAFAPAESGAGATAALERRVSA